LSKKTGILVVHRIASRARNHKNQLLFTPESMLKMSSRAEKRMGHSEKNDPFE
jgi:hypothetical protein